MNSGRDISPNAMTNLRAADVSGNRHIIGGQVNTICARALPIGRKLSGIAAD